VREWYLASMTTRRMLRLALAALGCCPGLALAQTLLGPSAYLSQADSPFDLSGLGSTFFLEDFEDNALSTPGVMASTGSPTGPGGLTDSVDADDGMIDGSGTNGHSFFSGSGSAGITFTFDPVALGGFPTAAGIVWTDGEGDVSFEAFDALGGSLGTIGPVSIADGSVVGTTAEDRFFGAHNPGGISAIHISNVNGGIEVDHLQYGAAALASTTTTTIATTSTVTTTATSSTTSTTAPAGGCAGVAVGPTFASLNCRLAALLAEVNASSQLGSFQTRIRQQVEKAKSRKEDAEARCRAGDDRHTKSGLAKAIRKMIQLKHALGSPHARKTIPQAVRDGLRAEATAIQNDLRTLKGSVRCPEDAG